MQVIERAVAMKKYISSQRGKGRTIGFISTQGYLNQSHVEMIERSKRENDITIISVFVNIAQFSSSEEYKKYPRDFERDYKISEEAGADVMFFPENSDMYTANSLVFVDIEGPLAGTRSRGIATIIMKLFNIIKPDRAYFSQKNIREIAVVEKMVSDLYIDVNIVPCPISRDLNGLAISSENENLTPLEKEQAVLIHMALEYAEMEITHGERNASHLKRVIASYMQDAPLCTVEQISIISYDTFKDAIQIKGKTLISITVKFPSTKLTDNLIINV